MSFSLDEVFKSSGGRVSRDRLNNFIDNLPLTQWDREYVKRVMEKFDNPGYSEGITKEEFLQGLSEMEKNIRDPIDREKVLRIKNFFGIK
jgi:hypothetical protein